MKLKEKSFGFYFMYKELIPMKPRYITRGIQATIPPWLQTLLWYMRDSMEVPERDYLQIFRLSCDGEHQRIEHAQEQPEYKHVVVIPGEQPVDAKVYIIEDPGHVTMLLADEY